MYSRRQILLAGGGLTSRGPVRFDKSLLELPHLVFGVGGEYLIKPKLGISLDVVNRYYLTDQLDQLSAGRYNDYYWAGKLGLVFYLGRTKPSI